MSGYGVDLLPRFDSHAFLKINCNFTQCKEYGLRQPSRIPSGFTFCISKIFVLLSLSKTGVKQRIKWQLKNILFVL